MSFNVTYTLQATPEQVQALSAIGLTLQDCRQVDATHTLIAVQVEPDRVREFWIATHGGMTAYEMKGKFVEITEKVFK